MRWQLKCVIDTAKASLPFQRHLRLLKDRLLGYQRERRREQNTIRDALALMP